MIIRNLHNYKRLPYGAVIKTTRTFKHRVHIIRTVHTRDRKGACADTFVFKNLAPSGVRVCQNQKRFLFSTPIQRYLCLDIDCVLLSFLLIHLSFTFTPIKIKLFYISYYSSIQFAYFCSLHSFVQFCVLSIVSHNFVPLKWNLSVRKPKMPSFLEVIFESRKTNNK